MVIITDVHQNKKSVCLHSVLVCSFLLLWLSWLQLRHFMASYESSQSHLHLWKCSAQNPRSLARGLPDYIEQIAIVYDLALSTGCYKRDIMNANPTLANRLLVNFTQVIISLVCSCNCITIKDTNN